MSVLPAPVSPVITVMPPPSGQQQVGDDPEVLDAQLDQHRHSPIGKVELGFEDLVEVPRAQRREAQRFGRRGARDSISGGELAELAAVEREHDAPIVAYNEPELLTVGEHERPVEQHVRRHRREHEAAQRRRRDRAPDRERVRRGAGRRRDDHAVGRVGREGACR